MNQANSLIELERALAHIRLTSEPLDDQLEELKQQYETILSLLESDFLGALLSGDWTEFDQLINDFRCPKTSTTDESFQEHQETRSRFHQLITQLKTQGVSVSELIEAIRNELTLLHLEDDRNAKVSADELHSPSADFSQPTRI